MTSNDSVDYDICIYCLENSAYREFNREHIIPESVGGTLYADGLVCEPCNSTLGHSVDFELLRVPAILTAMDELGVPYDRKGVLRSYYDTHLVSESDRLRVGVTDTGFQLVTQDLGDGSRITPGHNLPIETLHTNLSRDNALREAGVTGEVIAASLLKLQRKFEEADIGEEVACDDLPLTLIKRSEELHVEATPKSKPAVERTIGKIAYEFLFKCFGWRFIDSARWIEELRDLVCGTAASPKINIFRSEPIDPEIRKNHSIYVYLHPSYTKVAVGLFGGIEYTLIAPQMDHSVMDDFKSQTGISDAIGVAFRQDLAEAKKHFFALRADGSSQYLGGL